MRQRHKRRRATIAALILGPVLTLAWNWANREPHWCKASRAWDSTDDRISPYSY